MDLTLTRRLLILAGLAVAVAAGWNIANDELALVAIAASVALLGVISHLTGVAIDAFVMGLVLVGYLVGNRGFAQLHLPGLPLLPGEFALGLGLACEGWRAVRHHSQFLRRDALNLFVLIWIALGASRMPLDLRTNGFMAARDFALVYYALFFFLAQAWAELPAARRWLTGCVTWGLALAAPVFAAFLAIPDWFSTHLLIAGTPLIFVKNDVAGGFVAGATLWFAHRYATTRRFGWFMLAAVALAGVGISNNRGSVVALAGGALVLVILRSWKVVRVLVTLGALGVATLGVQAAVSERPFTASPLYRLYESMASVADVGSNRVYRATDLDDKPDNNQFRLVWWRAVVLETWTDGRWLGLGFGHDLAAEFLRIYYADNNDDFSVRSPHNFLLSVFGRMGLLGFLGFAGIVSLIGRQLWRARQTIDDPESSLPLWLAAVTILGGACFGVVLEGPMGAVVFWSLLGLANAAATRPLTSAAADAHDAPPADQDPTIGPVELPTGRQSALVFTPRSHP